MLQRKDRWLVTGFFVLLSIAGRAQASAIKTNVDADNSLIQLGDHNGVGLNEITRGIPVRKGEILGSLYYTDEWSSGYIGLYKKKTYKNLSIRYNEFTCEIEIKEDTGISSVRASDVQSFALTHRDKRINFINVNEFTVQPIGVKGFFEIILDDSVKLLKHSKVLIKPASYNEKLGYGSLNDKFVRRNVYYISYARELFELPKTLKKAKSIFGVHYPTIKTAIEQNNWNWREEDGLVKIIAFYNTLWRSSKV